ncbi:hypothetical protein [Kineococcus sp. SYSU DK003]|uniref:hypothetical protein n=1 Tax=Kineococcus sp. SYSU DK003 TaxID=3383124 RepID=UPI003D7EE55E
MSLDPGTAGEVKFPLAPGARALAQARRFLGLYAQQSGVPGEHAEDVVQAAAELMAVGGRARQVLTLAVHEHPDQLSVLVDLAGSADVEVSDEGALLLNGLSSQWGWRQLPGYTQVWCDVPKQPDL